MANLNGLTIDKDVKENDGSFTVLPAGKYKACLVGDELKDNKKGTGKILKLKVQIIEGQFSQEIIEDNLNITNPSQVSQAIGQGTLKRICNLCGVPFPPQDTNGLMGKPLVITVKVEEFTSNTSGKPLKSNKITKYEPADAQIPQPDVAAQAQTAAPSASGW